MNKSNRVHARAISLENDTNEGDLAKKCFRDHRISRPTGLPLVKENKLTSLYFLVTGVK